jgi:hypothetical protein
MKIQIIGVNAMEYSFTLFEPQRSRLAKVDEPLVEIRPNGRIIFNRQASEMLNHSHFCMLGYDSNHKALGLLPIADRKLNAFPVRYAAKGAYIGAKRFFKHFNILPAKLIENSPFFTGEFISIHMQNQ